MTTLFAIFTALTKIDSILGYLETFASEITGWYIARQKADTMSKIADAAALAVGATTDDQRYAASQAWQAALSRTRIIS